MTRSGSAPSAKRPTWRAEFAADLGGRCPASSPIPPSPIADVTAPQALLAAHQAERSRCASDLGVAGERLEAARLAARTAAQMRADAAGYDGAARLAASLEQELHRNRFIAYVQREAMQLLAQRRRRPAARAVERSLPAGRRGR